jgi:hypothetical protein
MNTMSFNFGKISRNLVWLVALVAMNGGAIARADDPAASTEKKAVEPNADSSTSEPADADKSLADKPAADKTDPDDEKNAKPGDPSILDRLTKELFKELDDSPEAKPATQKDDKLERAAKGMRSAGERLDERQTDKDTREIQEQVIRDLDDLIKQLQNPPPNGGGGGGGGGGASGKIGQLQRMQKQGGSQGRNSKMATAQLKPLGAEKGGGQEKKEAEGSDKRTESERKAADEAARKKKLEIDVWGHLPPHLREQLLNTYGERMLPKYENLVKQFYEALSEQNDSSPRR